MPSVDDYLAFVRSSAGPILKILARLDAGRAGRGMGRHREQLHAFDNAYGWEGPNELLITAGRRPERRP